MRKPDIQAILPLVEKPSRYLGTEINRVRKDLSSVKLKIALAFPDLYEVGTSHFGIQILYRLLNRETEIAAERVFAPAPDMENALRRTGLPLTSLESRLPLHRFDMLGVSLLYELDYTNVLTILDLGGIPFLSKERNETHPVVVAGGPCTVNPEPMADFFDAMVIGDGEEAFLEMARIWLEWRTAGRNREALLQEWITLDGVYVPAFYHPKIETKTGFQRLVPRKGAPETVRRAVVSDLDTAFFPEAPVVPFGKPVHDRLRLEVARGCTRGCRFCQAGMIYRPVRERSPATLARQFDAAMAATGYEDVSLLSLSTGDYSCLAGFLTRLMSRCETERTAVSLPSLRAGTLTPELMNLIKKVRKTGFTIAPEAGSQRLRDVINKNVTRVDILNSVEDAFNAGWNAIKLYFMIGLPTETEADLDALVDLVDELRGRKSRRSKIHVSLGTFIPKPHTPFQWCSQLAMETAADRLARLKERLRRPGIQIRWQSPGISHLEGLWSRGDRRLSRLLLTAYRNGCRLDAWTDHFRWDRWQASLREADVDPAFFTTRERSLQEPLPWDHIDVRVDKSYLASEWRKALSDERTADCRDGDCQDCGVCDFSEIVPRLGDETWELTATEFRASSPIATSDTAIAYEIFYSKTGIGRFYGHLEMASLFCRAIRRAGLPVQYSEGFHPMPKVAFQDALPIGMESECESFYMTARARLECRNVPAQINPLLPEGLAVLDCRVAPAKKLRKPPESYTYRVALTDATFNLAAVETFSAGTEPCIATMRKKSSDIEIDLRQAVMAIKGVSNHCLEMSLAASQGRRIRPLDVVKALFDLPEQPLKTARVIKLCQR